MSAFIACITAIAFSQVQLDIQRPGGGEGQGPGRGAARTEGIQDYATVTKDFEKKDGVFKVWTKRGDDPF